MEIQLLLILDIINYIIVLIYEMRLFDEIKIVSEILILEVLIFISKIQIVYKMVVDVGKKNLVQIEEYNLLVNINYNFGM
jgi:hypothetical protein